MVSECKGIYFTLIMQLLQPLFFAKPLFLLPRARFNKGGVKCHLGNPEKHTDFHTETYRLSVRKSVCFLV